MPRQPERAAGQEPHTPPVLVVKSAEPINAANGASAPTQALATVGPTRVDPDPGLYAVLGLDPSATDAEIQSTYCRHAARLQGGGARQHALLRQLNAAYEVLGTRVRREDYDRLRMAQLLAPSGPTPIHADAKAPARATRRRRPRHAVQPHYAGFSYVLAVLCVVGLAVAAGVLIILPRLSFNLSALNALHNVLPIANTARRAADVAVSPAPTSEPLATVQPGAAERFAGSSVSVSNPTPAQNTLQTVSVKIRRDGQAAANAAVWAIVKYTTTEERWPATGTQQTDASGATTISFNIGRAVPDHPVPVTVFAQVGDQQFSWSTSFTPH